MALAQWIKYRPKYYFYLFKPWTIFKKIYKNQKQKGGATNKVQCLYSLGLPTKLKSLNIQLSVSLI